MRPDKGIPRDLAAARDRLLAECQPDKDFLAELEKATIEEQLFALAFVVGLRREMPIRH